MSFAFVSEGISPDTSLSLKSVAHLKNKQIHKSKYQRGRRADKEMWVFGITDTSTKPAITYLETVEKRDAATLLPIIEKVVRPGSIVYSDEWRAYRQIQPKLMSSTWDS